MIDPTVSSEPEIPGATYSFDPNPIRVFTDVKISIDTTLETTPGVYTITFGGTSRADGMVYTPFVVQLAIKPVIVPTVFNPTIWWFNLPQGQPQRDGYPTTLRLEALPPGAASYQWEIVSGSDKATLALEPGNPVNSVVVYSTDMKSKTSSISPCRKTFPGTKSSRPTQLMTLLTTGKGEPLKVLHKIRGGLPIG